MLLEVDNVVKDYRGGLRANDGISLSVDRGEVFGLLGPNGAGKTDSGEPNRSVDRADVWDDRDRRYQCRGEPAHARKACSYQLQGDVPLDGFTPKKLLSSLAPARAGAAGMFAREHRN